MNTLEKIATYCSGGAVLCAGLDTVLEKIPNHLPKEVSSILKFNLDIIEATKSIVSSYKINFAFYEVFGSEGFDVLKKTFEAIPDDKFKIADAKRGDIGNTSTAYAKSVFEYFKADAITVSPYMGRDSVSPFLDFKDKVVFILARTSNIGAGDFQMLETGGEKLYRKVVETSLSWGEPEHIGFVAGATSAGDIKEIRDLAPKSPLLIPGIGAQGGSLADTLEANGTAPAFINVSRDLIYASSGLNFAEKAAEKAKEYTLAMNKK